MNTLVQLPQKNIKKIPPHLFGRPRCDPAVLLRADVPPLLGLDAHARWVPQLEVEGLRRVGLGGGGGQALAALAQLEVLAVLAYMRGVICDLKKYMYAFLHKSRKGMQQKLSILFFKKYDN